MIVAFLFGQTEAFDTFLILTRMKRGDLVVTYSFVSKGMERVMQFSSLEEALKKAAYDSESRVRIPSRISIKTRNSIASYGYHEIIILCKRFGFLK